MRSATASFVNPQLVVRLSYYCYFSFIYHRCFWCYKPRIYSREFLSHGIYRKQFFVNTWQSANQRRRDACHELMNVKIEANTIYNLISGILAIKLALAVFLFISSTKTSRVWLVCRIKMIADFGSNISIVSNLQASMWQQQMLLQESKQTNE